MTSILQALAIFAGVGAAIPASAATKYGYAGNAGWVDFAPSATARVKGADRFLHGFAYGANFGWINFGDGSPANGTSYSNSSGSDFGVNHDGRGILSGFAYGANIGWINFGWAAANEPHRPCVDLVTGKAFGYAYSANLGWINLSDLIMPGVRAALMFTTGSAQSDAGSPVTLAVGGTGSETLGYEWLFNGALIHGATSSSYTLASLQTFHEGVYTVRITREDGSTTELDPATLEAMDPPPNDARLLNLSTRGLVQTGDNVLIPGFVISSSTGSPQAGSANKRLLIRAVGPTLAQSPFNLAGTLPDPQMRLLKRNPDTSAFEEIAANDDWGTSSNAAAITQTGAEVSAFALNDPRETALLLDLAPGEYTVVAGGDGNGTGLAIAELYDADADSPASRLINISNRGFCGVGDQVMIPGFVVSPEGPKTFLIRVVGPTLGAAPFNVPGTMVDPKLEIFPGSASAPILTNDNWSDNAGAAHTAQVAQEVSAFALTGGSKDAAFVVTLPPGIYTVVGSSAIPNGDGIVLVEVYLKP